MQVLQAVFVGAVQGISEFLPISSSAHIVFAQSIYKIATGSQFLNEVGSQEIFFDIMVHLATLLAVVIFFRKDIIEIIKAFFLGLKNKDYTNPDFKTAVFILAATPITCIVALILKEPTHALVENPKIVSLFLILTGFILYFSEKLKSKNKDMNLKTALWTGLAQGLAVFPGLSRSGTTIATGLICGVRRDVMAQFSFLMVLVPILGSSFLDLLSGEVANSSVGWLPLLLGFVSAFLSGLFACKVMIALVKKAKLGWFSLYCVIVAALVFIFM